MLSEVFLYLSDKDNIYLPGERLDSLRLSLLKKQLMFAYHKFSYYKNSFNKAGLNPQNFNRLSDLSLYPIITKDIVRQHLSNVISQKSHSNKILKSHTSGSTGQPMWTYYDIKSWIRKKYLDKIRARIECGTRFHDRVAIFEPYTSKQKKRRNIGLLPAFPIINFNVYSMFEPYELTIKSLKKFLPQSMYGMPGYFFRLAQKLAEINLKIPSIKQIYTSSEYLQYPVRQYIQKIFNADVFDIYGSTEFKEVAWECEKHEGYHINEDSVIVEVINNGTPAKPGVIGNIVLTDLRNTVMPLIRYQMYDKGVLINKKCSCGRTFSLMKPVAGRASEYITLPGGEELSPYLFTTSIECLDGLLQYQVVQLTREKLIVLALTNTSDFERIAFQIHKIFSGILNNSMSIEVQHCTKLDCEENGKFKVIKNLCMK